MRGLVLAGGLSERMGSPKAFLEYKDRPLYLRAFELLSPICSEVYVSGRLGQYFDVPTIYDCNDFAGIGPASGILSAYEQYNDTWFILACDFPLATYAAVNQLFKAHRPPATYFGVDGQIEPLFSIWSPEALETLKNNVKAGKTGPIYTLKAMGPYIEPLDKNWLVNTNTPEEWHALSAR